MSFEELETLVNGIKEKLDETTSALVSEDLLSIVSNYKSALENINDANEQINTLKEEKDELLKVNGRLFQKIGFDKEPEEQPSNDSDEEKISIDDIIDEKGEFKDE